MGSDGIRRCSHPPLSSLHPVTASHPSQPPHHLAAAVDEEAVRLLHDVGLVDGGHLGGDVNAGCNQIISHGRSSTPLTCTTRMPPSPSRARSLHTHTHYTPYKHTHTPHTHRLPPVLLGVLERKLRDARRRLARDDLEGLDDALHHLVLQPAVLALGVLAGKFGKLAGREVCGGEGRAVSQPGECLGEGMVAKLDRRPIPPSI
jgi:hypothetical protein